MSKTNHPLGNAKRLGDALEQLAETVDARAIELHSDSYTAKLLARGPVKVAKKVAEEGAELALAIAAEGKKDVAAEAADVLYHMLVGLRVRGVELDDVAKALESRRGMSGLEEKAARRGVKP